MVKVSTFSEAADYVARDFVKTMKEEGFETFEEMKKCYWWEPEDIRQEIISIVDETNAYFYDDGSAIVLPYDEEMDYKSFKKLVLLRVDRLMKH